MPASSNVAIANMALQIVGAKPITSFDEDAQFATLIASVFDTERDATLRAYPWNFASKRAALGRLATAPAFGFEYQFQLPTDCVRVLAVYPETPFVVEGRMVLCDTSEISILYTASIASPVTWDASFKSALAAKLAMKICYAATEMIGMVDRAQAAYDKAIAEARTADAQEGSTQSALGTDAYVLVDVRRTLTAVDSLPVVGSFGSL